MWAPFEKRLADARVALLTSAGIYLTATQPTFDLEREHEQPEWGDPTWRSIPAGATSDALGVAHLHINDEDILADPEVALPMRMLDQLSDEGVVGGSVAEHVAVMGYQDRGLEHWRETTAPQVVEHLRQQGATGLVLAPA